MRRELLYSLLAPAVLLTLGGGWAQAYIVEGRWSRTATNGTNTGTNGTAITLTWSIAPDGTTIPGNSSGTVPSNLLNFLDTTFGAGPGGSDLSQRPWFTYFDQAFARISALSGVTYLYDPKSDGHPVVDDGRRFSNSTTGPNAGLGVLGVRGDVRIGARSYGDGSNTLASNYYPDYGEMIFNSDKGSYFSVSTNNYRRLRNTIMHEALHGLGIGHVESSNGAFLMEPTLGTSFDGPQLDDILALHRLYGDRYEKNGGNNTYQTATPLGLLMPASPIAIGTVGDHAAVGVTQVDFVSISGTADTDFFRFTVDARLDVNLQLTPRGTTYMMGEQGKTQNPYNTLALNNLALALFDTNGTSLLASADANPSGMGESILHQLLPGTYYARVRGAQNEVQLYGLNLSATVTGALHLLWTGNGNSNWTIGVSKNFEGSSGATMFFDGDHVTFDDTSSVKSVRVAENVAPGSMRVTTAGRYTFHGPGGIVASSLTIDGPGLVELANSGSSQYHTVQLSAGTLRVSGAASFTGETHLAEDATLQLAGTQVFETTSRLTGNGQLIGDVVMPGTIAPGSSAGQLSFGDNLTLLETSRLEIQLGGLTSALEFDALSIAGTATLDGALDISLLDVFAPAANDSFEFLRAEGGIFGQFDLVTLPTLASDLLWDLVYSEFSVLLRVVDPNVVAPLPGDFNHDGVVDAADYIVWRRGLDTLYTADDYDLWRGNFGTTAGGDGGDSRGGQLVDLGTLVPEPGALMLALMACIIGLAARRR